MMKVKTEQLCSNVLLYASIHLDGFGILRCFAFLCTEDDNEKVLDEEVVSSTPLHEPSATGMNSKSTGIIQMQHSVI